jgi:hypothetical protein
MPQACAVAVAQQPARAPCAARQSKPRIITPGAGRRAAAGALTGSILRRHTVTSHLTLVTHDRRRPVDHHHACPPPPPPRRVQTAARKASPGSLFAARHGMQFSKVYCGKARKTATSPVMTVTVSAGCPSARTPVAVTTMSMLQIGFLACTCIGRVGRLSRIAVA